MAMQFGRGGMSRAAAVAMGGLAVLCCLLLLAISSSDTQTPTALMHVGALAQAQTAMAAADVKAGGTDILPDVDDLDVDSGIGYSAPKSRSLRRSAHDGHAYHRGDDSQATQDELRKSAQHIGLLSARDDAVQKAADEAAEHDLDSYNTGISASLDDYARISKSIDAQSRSVFNPKPKKHVKPAVDPFKDDESVWHQMGVPSHSDVFGVPHEFRGMKAVSFKHAEDHPDYNLPDFVRRAEAAAQGEMAPGEGDSVAEAHDHANRQRHMQAQMARAAEAARHKARTEGKAQQVVTLVRDAVKKALHDNLAKKEAAARAAQQHTLNAAFFPSAQEEAQQQKQQQAVWATATPVTVAGQAPAFASPSTHHLASSASSSSSSPRLAAPSPGEAKLLARERAAREREDQQHRQQQVAYVKQLAEAYEQRLHRPRSHAEARKKAREGARAPREAERDGEEEEGKDSAIRDGEAQEVATLKAEVKKMREEQRVEALRRQVRRLREKLQAKKASLSHHSSPSSSSSSHVRKSAHVQHHPLRKHRTHSLAAAQPAAEEGEEGEEGEGAHEEGGEEHAEEGGEEHEEEEGAEHAEEEKAKPKKIKICDGMGCYYKTANAPPKPEERHHPSTKEGIKQALEGGVDLGQLIFPWEHTWTSEVHLNDEGQIRADHDDPHGALEPHLKYQNADYPEGEHERDAEGKERPGVTNQVGTHLFADNIVTAAPGFNSGLGRHTRAQQAADWERNWETERESKEGIDEDGRKIVVK